MKSKRKLKNTFRQMKMKAQPYKIYVMQEKQLEVSSQQYRPSSKNKKNLK